MPIDKETHQGKLCSKNLDFCILKVTGVLIEKTLMLCISFRKYNSLKYNHVRIQKVMSEAGGPKWPNIECWLGSFVIFQGILTSIA